MIMLEKDEQARSQPCFRTPLDFTSREIWSCGLVYDYCLNLFKGMYARLRGRQRKHNSFGRRSENDVLPLKGVASAINWISGFAFLSTNFIAWNFHFPTSMEQRLWHISSCGLVAVGAGGVAFTLWYNDRRIAKMQEKVRERRLALESTVLPGTKATWKQWFSYHFRVRVMRICNNSLNDDPNLDAAPVFNIFGVAGFTLYGVARAYILVEDVVAFRALPTKAYLTVNWAAFLPHV